jgi:hypothetical protein
MIQDDRVEGQGGDTVAESVLVVDAAALESGAAGDVHIGQGKPGFIEDPAAVSFCSAGGLVLVDGVANGQVGNGVIAAACREVKHARLVVAVQDGFVHARALDVHRVVADIVVDTQIGVQDDGHGWDEDGIGTRKFVGFVDGGAQGALPRIRGALSIAGMGVSGITVIIHFKGGGCSWLHRLQREQNCEDNCDRSK